MKKVRFFDLSGKIKYIYGNDFNVFSDHIIIDGVRYDYLPKLFPNFSRG